MSHRIYWSRGGPPGGSVVFLIECSRGCDAHPPQHRAVLGILDPGRAEHYAAQGAGPAWLCGWGLRGGALARAVRLAAREPNAAAGWVTPEGCRATVPGGRGVG